VVRHDVNERAAVFSALLLLRSAALGKGLIELVKTASLNYSSIELKNPMLEHLSDALV